jgi:TonB family protein
MRWGIGRRSRRAACWFLLLSLALGGGVLGQDLKRKVIARTAPSYPELARRIHLSGKVKLELVITPGGSVKSARLVGGNPVFEKSATDAAKQWRFEAAEKETKAVILLEFSEP